MPINLKTTVVESREQRLGTIVAWEGQATDLAEKSGYSRGNCASGCSKRPAKSVNFRTVHSRLHMQRNDGGMSGGKCSGCGYCTTFTHRLRSRSGPLQLSIQKWLVCKRSSCGKFTPDQYHLREKDMVYGGIEKLENSVREAKDVTIRVQSLLQALKRPRVRTQVLDSNFSCRNRRSRRCLCKRGGNARNFKSSLRIISIDFCHFPTIFLRTSWKILG